jgi:hypothetical protein
MASQVINKFEKIINHGEQLKDKLEKIPENEIYKSDIYLHCVIAYFNSVASVIEKMKEKNQTDPMLIDNFIKILKIFKVNPNI